MYILSVFISKNITYTPNPNIIKDTTNEIIANSVVLILGNVFTTMSIFSTPCIISIFTDFLFIYIKLAQFYSFSIKTKSIALELKL